MRTHCHHAWQTGPQVVQHGQAMYPLILHRTHVRLKIYSCFHILILLNPPPWLYNQSKLRQMEEGFFALQTKLKSKKLKTDLMNKPTVEMQRLHPLKNISIVLRIQRTFRILSF